MLLLPHQNPPVSETVTENVDYECMSRAIYAVVTAMHMNVKNDLTVENSPAI